MYITFSNTVEQSRLSMINMTYGSYIDMWFGLVGTAGWLWVGMLWHDRALIMLNAVLVALLGAGLMNFYFGV